MTRAWVLPMLAMLLSSALYVGMGMVRGGEAGAAAAAGGGAGLTGGGVGGSAGFMLPDPLSVFSARSPGGRAGGAFLQTKPAYASSDFAGPRETLGMPFDRSLDPAPPPPEAGLGGGGGEGLGGAGFPFAGEPFSDGFDGVMVIGGFSQGGSLVPGIVGGNGGAGGGGGGFSPAPLPDFDGDGVDDIVDDVTIAVPEPESWAMMIFGFLMVGSAMRARARRRMGAGAGAR
ncbi:MAG: PEPxxWA-CTERM sorting domain-containing protein [Polymorphobacter sp.]|uniref:PEPxxWA-CTERM sorting domain-containing protein n=1 Tax=Polymorphobacter sp. TaxID=1909290 RepID=UPI003A863268